MRFWMSGEVHQELGQMYLAAVNSVIQALNTDLGAIEYAIPVDSWDVIGILLPGGIPGFDEVQAFDSKKREVEFRLRIHYELFKAAEAPEEREWIVFLLILRSVDLFREMIGFSMEVDKFRSDIVAVGQKHGWFEDGILCEDDD